jgi:uncharacterized protein YciI
MPNFVFCARDRPDARQIRAGLRERHRAYIRIAQAGCRCVAGGPLMYEGGEQMTGALPMFDARDRKAVGQSTIGATVTSAADTSAAANDSFYMLAHGAGRYPILRLLKGD